MVFISRSVWRTLRDCEGDKKVSAEVTGGWVFCYNFILLPHVPFFDHVHGKNSPVKATSRVEQESLVPKFLLRLVGMLLHKYVSITPHTQHVLLRCSTTNIQHLLVTHSPLWGGSH